MPGFGKKNYSDMMMIVSNSEGCAYIEKRMAGVSKETKDMIETASKRVFDGLEINLRDNFSETVPILIHGRVITVRVAHTKAGGLSIEILTGVVGEKEEEIWVWKMETERVRGFVIGEF